MDADGPCFLWIIAREPSDWTTAGGTKIRAAHAVYSNNIRNALMDCRVLPQSMKEARSHTWAGEDWNRCLATMNIFCDWWDVGTARFYSRCFGLGQQFTAGFARLLSPDWLRQDAHFLYKCVARVCD